MAIAVMALETGERSFLTESRRDLLRAGASAPAHFSIPEKLCWEIDTVTSAGTSDGGKSLHDIELHALSRD